jgi:Methyltransferase FkbM domain
VVDRRRFWLIAGATLIAVILGAVVRNQIKVYQGRQARTLQERQELFDREQRRGLFEMLQPVALANCQLERFGEANDGGYLMCGNLLGDVQSGYSYGISGYDKWGCDISSTLHVPVHQYDCFNPSQPVCPDGKTVFHLECVGPTAATVEGRYFDTIDNQFTKNGDDGKRIVLKIDVEGAEWDSLLSTPDEVLQRIDQMAVEFHWELDDARWTQQERYARLVRRLKQFFEIVHIHFNNASCLEGLEPFPTWAYEVLFVSKRLAVIDPSRRAGGLHPLDAPNNPTFEDCQPKPR